MTESSTERMSPLHDVHEKLGASFTDFAGWQMPVRYSSDLAEHKAVREAAGIFDISHMGEIEVRGSQAGEFLDFALAGRLSALTINQAKYTLLLNEAGGVIDDLIVYRLGDERFWVVANAANRFVDLDALKERSADFAVEIDDKSDDIAMIAVQGPASETILLDSELEIDGDLTTLRYYRVMPATFRGVDVLIARTGYTGEDGFELYIDKGSAVDLWHEMERAGDGRGLQPCGLASRDTLRLEAGMPLYGHELGTELNPQQAGLGGVIPLARKGEFVGRAGIEAGVAEDAPVLVGLVGDGRRAGRAGYPVVADGREIGNVTSGALSPTIGVPIALAYVSPTYSEAGTELAIDVRGKHLAARVVPLPFYSRKAER